MVSVIIPAKNEVYLEKTIRNVLENAEGEIEIIVELDGYTPDPQIVINDERVIFVYHKEGIGQRACINHGASIAKGKYIMKLDAHCAVSPGFDVILARDCEPSWTMIPTMYCLDIETWKPKLYKRTDYMYITSPSMSGEGNANSQKPFRAAYFNRQPKNDKMIDDTLCAMGPGWFMTKERFLFQGGCDEGHEGGWGAQSIEISLKAWLSGGALKVDKNCWFAHWFRKEFPWPASGRMQERVRKYSRDLWLNNKWSGQVRPLSWVIQKFWPVPGWTDNDLANIMELGINDKFNPPGWKKNITIIYYTANVVHRGIEYSVLRSLRKHGYPIVSVSQKPMDLGKNIVVPQERSKENIYRQVLIGAKEATTEYVALCEDDCLYVPEHFKYRPQKAFGYNLNRWLLHLAEKTFSYRKRPILSQCIAHRQTLIECLEKGDRDKEMGREDGYEFETFETKEPNLVICHNKNTCGRKYIGEDAEPKQEVLPWGTVDYWVNKFEGRGYGK